MSGFSERRASLWATYQKLHGEETSSIVEDFLQKYRSNVDTLIQRASKESTEALARAKASWVDKYDERCREHGKVLGFLESGATCWPEGTAWGPVESERPKRAVAFVSELSDHAERSFRFIPEDRGQSDAEGSDPGAEQSPPERRWTYDVPRRQIVSGARDILDALAGQVNRSLPIAEDLKLTSKNVVRFVETVENGIAEAPEDRRYHRNVGENISALMGDLEVDTADDALKNIAAQRAELRKRLRSRLADRGERLPPQLEDTASSEPANDTMFGRFPDAFKRHHAVHVSPQSKDFDVAELAEALLDQLRWTDADTIYDNLHSDVMTTLDREILAAENGIDTGRAETGGTLRETLATVATRLQNDLRAEWADRAEHHARTLHADLNEEQSREMRDAEAAFSAARTDAREAGLRAQTARVDLDAIEQTIERTGDEAAGTELPARQAQAKGTVDAAEADFDAADEAVKKAETALQKLTEAHKTARASLSESIEKQIETEQGILDQLFSEHAKEVTDLADSDLSDLREKAIANLKILRQDIEGADDPAEQGDAR